MRRSMRCAALAFAAVALCLVGCEAKSFRIRIPDFDSSRVGGLWIYEYSDSSGKFEKVWQLVFTEPFEKEGMEVLSYTADGFVDEDGKQVHVETEVVRNPANPDEVTMEIWFPCEPPTAIKVSTYNAVDESPLSDTTVYLYGSA